jgi:hypothetical protein
MLRPKRTIPSLVVAALALTGCGHDNEDPAAGGAGGTAGAGGAPGSMTAEAAAAFCMKVGECYPNTPYEQYCRDYTAGLDLLAGYFSTECDAFLASYFTCLAELSCEEYMGPEFDACYDDLDQDMLDACYAMLPQQ